ncbi:MAG: YbaK/EbsC family protein [Patescibacteria group bacterium]
MTISQSVLKHLAKIKVSVEKIPHRTVFTAYDLAQTLKISLTDIAKTLLIKADSQYYLVVVSASARLDLGKLKKLLKAKKVTLAKEKEMKTKFHVKPGAITPFGTIHKVGVVMDKALGKTKTAIFGAGSFTESLRVKISDYIRSEHPVQGTITVPSGLKIQLPKPKPKKKKRPIKKSGTSLKKTKKK